MRRVRWMVAAGLCLVVAAPAAASQPDPGAGLSAKRPGVLKGRLAQSSGKWSKRLPGTVMALRLLPGIDQYSVIADGNRRWRMKVAPGVYGVIMTRRKGNRSVVTARAVRVKAGKTARLRDAQLSAVGPLVSIGRITGPDGVNVTDMMIAEMIGQADDSPCDFNVVEEKNSPGYRKVLDELKLQTTKHFPEATQRAARKALRDLTSTGAQYRVEGSIDRGGAWKSGAASGTFRLVQVGTGNVLVEKQITSGAGTDAVFNQAAAALAKSVCGVPTGFAGTVRADITSPDSGQKWQWNGTAGFVLDDGGERPDGSFVLTYKLETLTVDSATYTSPPSGSCSEVRATWSGAPPVRDGSLTLTVAADGSRNYRLSLGVVTDSATASTTCDQQAVAFPTVMGLGVNSDPAESWLGPTMAETYSGPWTPISGVAASALQMDASWVLLPVGLD
ncbi:MAG: hypothetical protein R2720_00125 [Candidatus Nanopelagicales bacterium]